MNFIRDMASELTVLLAWTLMSGTLLLTFVLSR